MWPADSLGSALTSIWGEASGTFINKIGLATSSDGVTWTKSGSNPVLVPGGEQYGALQMTVPARRRETLTVCGLGVTPEGDVE